MSTPIRIGPFLRGVTGPPIISPGGLPNLELYVDSRLGVSGSDGAAITTWPDQTPNLRDLLRQGATPAPTLLTTSTTSPKGVQLLRWTPAPGPGFVNGTSMATAILTNLNFPTSARGMTVYMWGVFRATTNDFNLATGFRTITDGNWESGIQSSDGTHRMYIRTNSGGGATRLFGTAQVTPVTGVLTWIYRPPNDGTGAAQLYVNGTLQSPAASALWQITQTQTGNILVGTADTAGTRSFDADLGAVIWYSDAHTDAVRAGVERFLRRTFG